LKRISKIQIFIFAIFAIFIVWWIIELKQGKMPYVDQWTRGFVARLDQTPIYSFFAWITKLGSKSFMFPFTIVMSAVLLYLYRNVVPVIFFAFGTLGSRYLNRLIKHIIERDRPSISALLDAEGYSFPSGHAMNSIVCFSLLAYFMSRKFSSKQASRMTWLVASLMILLIGISRYVINVHFLTDIIAGFFFGSIWVFLLLLIYRKIRNRREMG